MFGFLVFISWLIKCIVLVNLIHIIYTEHIMFCKNSFCIAEGIYSYFKENMDAYLEVEIVYF